MTVVLVGTSLFMFYEHKEVLAYPGLTSLCPVLLKGGQSCSA